MPKVSVIVPCYNLGQYLPDALNSVRTQTFQDWECLIVDNGSTDKSRLVMTNFCASDQRFIPVVLHENHGVAAARNKGLELAEGEYILFLDADDMIGSDYMADAVSATPALPDTPALRDALAAAWAAFLGCTAVAPAPAPLPPPDLLARYRSPAWRERR